MNEARRRAYLEAMGYDVWVARQRGAAAACLQLAPGQGKCLLVCADAAETSSRLAGDIARTLGAEACWAWPGGDAGIGLAEAVADRLAVVVVVFGQQGARELLGENPPATLGSAAVLVVPAMSEIEASPLARQSLWRGLCRAGALPRA